MEVFAGAGLQVPALTLFWGSNSQQNLTSGSLASGSRTTSRLLLVIKMDLLLGGVLFGVGNRALEVGGVVARATQCSGSSARNRFTASMPP